MKAMQKSANFKGENLKRLLSGARKLMNSSITMVLAFYKLARTEFKKRF